MRIGHSGAAKPETDGRITNARSMIFSAAARLAGAMVSGRRGQCCSPADPPSAERSRMQGANLSFYFLSKDSGGQWKSFFSSQGHSSENSTMFGDASAGEEQPACGATESQRRDLWIFGHTLHERWWSSSQRAVWARASLPAGCARFPARSGVNRPTGLRPMHDTRLGSCRVLGGSVATCVTRAQSPDMRRAPGEVHERGVPRRSLGLGGFATCSRRCSVGCARVPGTCCRNG